MSRPFLILIDSAINLANVIISIANEVKKPAEIEDNKSLLLEYDLSKIDWQEYLLHFTYVTEALAGYRDSLVKAESDVDLKICDILHYIENNNAYNHGI